MRVTKATPEQKSAYAATKPVYPLYGFVTVDGRKCAVESLVGDPDLKYEVMAPEGYRFAGEETHTLLCIDMADLRGRLAGATFAKCDDTCEWCNGE